MNTAWRTLAWSQALTSVAVGTSLLARPVTGRASYTLARLDDLTGGLSFVGLACLTVGLLSVAAMATGRGIVWIYGAAASAFTLLATGLLFGSIFAGSGWTGAALAFHLAVANLVVVRAAAIVRARRRAQNGSTG